MKFSTFKSIIITFLIINLSLSINSSENNKRLLKTDKKPKKTVEDKIEDASNQIISQLKKNKIDNFDGTNIENIIRDQLSHSIFSNKDKAELSNNENVEKIKKKIIKEFNKYHFSKKLNEKKDLTFDEELYKKNFVKVYLYNNVELDDNLMDSINSYYKSIHKINLAKGETVEGYNNENHMRKYKQKEIYPNYIFEFNNKENSISIFGKINNHIGSKTIEERQAADEANKIWSERKSYKNPVVEKIPIKKEGVDSSVENIFMNKDNKKSKEIFSNKTIKFNNNTRKTLKETNLLNAMTTTLSQIGYQEVAVSPDGFCLTMSIASNNEGRRNANFNRIFEVLRNGDLELISDITARWGSVDAFVDVLTSPDGWAGDGGEDVISILARILRINVYVVNTNGSITQILQPNANQSVIITHNGNHFNATRPI